jgi:4-hydroxy-tetrahydrodipicolinate reductase
VTTAGGSTRTGIVVPGLFGRMGRLVALAAREDERFALVGATLKKDRPEVGQDIGVALERGPTGRNVTATLEDALGAPLPFSTQGTVVVDFTTPGNARAHARACMAHGAALVVGTTGLLPDDTLALEEAARTIPVLVSANMSVGAHLVAELAARAAKTLEEADVEIVELHHKRKKDTPSGTALMMARAVAEARGTREPLRTVRSGDAPRLEGEIGVFGVRGGDVVGEHTVYLFVDGERVELTHRVSDRAIFARGALRAARWLGRAAPGLYAMADVLKAA